MIIINFVHSSCTVKLLHSVFCLQSSSCLSDKDEDDIYDFAAKYEGNGKHHPFFWNGNKPKISPAG